MEPGKGAPGKPREEERAAQQGSVVLRGMQGERRRGNEPFKERGAAFGAGQGGREREEPPSVVAEGVEAVRLRAAQPEGGAGTGLGLAGLTGCGERSQREGGEADAVRRAPRAVGILSVREPERRLPDRVVGLVADRGVERGAGQAHGRERDVRAEGQRGAEKRRGKRV